MLFLTTLRAKALRVPRALSARALSSAPQFDEAMAKAYKMVAESHRHPDGPWPLMRDKVVEAVKERQFCTILDLASGPAEPAATIAEALPDALVTATDVAEPMVAAAEKATAHLVNVRVALADAQDLDVDDATYDVVTCCYGFMFPTDKEKALAETLRVLKPGGTLVATTWDMVHMMPLARDIMTDVLGKAPPTPDLDPMSFSEDGLFHSMVEGAGFVEVDQTTSTYPFEFGSDKDMQFRCGTIPLKQKLDELDCWAAAEEAFWKHAPKYTTIEDGALVMPGNTFRLTVARKPS